MTKFIDVSGEKKEETKTVFTHYLYGNNGWEETVTEPKDLKEVKYLGRCEVDGDIFSCLSDNNILIFKGTKGSEFN